MSRFISQFRSGFISVRSAAFVSAVIAAASVPVAFGDTYNWTAGIGSANQNWGDSSNWAKVPGGTHAVPGSADTAVVPAFTFSNGVMFGTNQSVAGLSLGTSAFFQTLDSFTLSVGSQGITGATGSDLLLNGGVKLTAAQTWSLPPAPPANGGLVAVNGTVDNGGFPLNLSLTSSATVLFSGNFTGSGGLTVAGGTVGLSSNNTFSGTTTLAGGTVLLGSGSALGSTPSISFTGGGGVLEYSSTSASTVYTDYSARIVNSTAPVTIDVVSGVTVTYGSALATSNTGGLIKQDAGTLILSGSNALTIGLTVNNGSVKLASAAGAVLPSLAIANNGAALGSRTYSGQLDVGQASMVIRGGNLASITDMARAGQNGAGGLFTGNGITSSAAAADAGVHLRYAVGVIPNNFQGGTIFSTFNGVTVGLNDVLVKFTYFGDADLSGTIDDTDFFLINNGFANHLTGWVNGDFDYSGTVDDTDFFLINNAFGQQNGVLRDTSGGSVPEPMGVGLMAAGVLGQLARRNRT